MTKANTLQIMTGNIPRPCVIHNAYYKHEVGSDGKPRRFMSGLPLPLDANGRLDGVIFINCEFHPCCPDITALGGSFTVEIG